MTTLINFFTAIEYEAPRNRIDLLRQKVDSYFYLGGKKASIIDLEIANKNPKQAFLCDRQVSSLNKVIKIASYFTLIIPIALLLTKAVLRSFYSVHVITKYETMQVSKEKYKEIKNSLVDYIGLISKLKNDSEIEWISKSDKNLVFKLKKHPNYIFKRPGASSPLATTRLINMVKATNICNVNQLDKIIIPKTGKIEVEHEGQCISFLVEEFFDIEKSESCQEELFAQHADTIKETMEQMAIFIAKSGLEDISWRNMPLLKEEGKFEKVVLVDLEYMNGRTGFSGGRFGDRGLIRCATSHTQIQKIIQKMQDLKLPQQMIDLAKKRAKDRKNEFAKNQSLADFYKKNEITKGNETIEIDLDSLGLDLEETANYLCEENGEEIFKKVSLREAVLEIVDYLNETIRTAEETLPIKARRQIFINTNRSSMQRYYYLGLSDREVVNLVINEENKNNLWLYRILNALHQYGKLFEFKEQSPGQCDRYIVQA